MIPIKNGGAPPVGLVPKRVPEEAEVVRQREVLDAVGLRELELQALE